MGSIAPKGISRIGSIPHLSDDNMAEERGEFKIVVNVKAKLEICEFVEVKDEVFKTKIACRHCEIELKYSDF